MIIALAASLALGQHLLSLTRIRRRGRSLRQSGEALVGENYKHIGRFEPSFIGLDTNPVSNVVFEVTLIDRSGSLRCFLLLQCNQLALPFLGFWGATVTSRNPHFLTKSITKAS